MRATATRKKEEENREKGKEGTSSSAPKAVGKGAPKTKADEKDDRPSKKLSVTPREKQPKRPSPPKSSHGTGKGLMTSTGPVPQGTRCLLTHKGYAVEMVESIIKETDVDPCAKQEMEDLGASGLFDLFRVSFLPNQFFFIVYLLADS